MLFIDRQEEPPAWHVVLYDPRPEAFENALGLELPFSARCDDGTLLTGWVVVSAADASLGVQCLRGVRPLHGHPLWHVRQQRAQNAEPQALSGPSSLLAAEPVPAELHRSVPGASRLLPSVLRRRPVSRQLAVLLVLTLGCWGSVRLVADIATAVEPPAQESAAAAMRPWAGSVVRWDVAILEQVGFDHDWTVLRDVVCLRLLRANGFTELHALLPGPGCILATHDDGTCQMVVRDLWGQRHRYHGLLRTEPASGEATRLVALLIR